MSWVWSKVWNEEEKESSTTYTPKYSGNKSLKYFNVKLQLSVSGDVSP